MYPASRDPQQFFMDGALRLQPSRHAVDEGWKTAAEDTNLDGERIVMPRLIAGLLVLALTALPVAAQQPGTAPHPQPGMGAGAAMPMMMADSLNQRLDTLLARMNQAKGNKKVDAMAAVINELVAQRKLMMGRMHEQMMDGMMRMHGTGGAPSPAPNRAGPADSAADTSGHAAHHPPQ